MVLVSSLLSAKTARNPQKPSAAMREVCQPAEEGIAAAAGAQVGGPRHRNCSVWSGVLTGKTVRFGSPAPYGEADTGQGRLCRSATRGRTRSESQEAN